jgi:hypothetical protein
VKHKILSYGGGLDSWTNLLLSIDGRFERPDLLIFADVSDGCPESGPTSPGEWPSTYRHIREVTMPLCEREGIEFKWLTTAEQPVGPTRANPAGCRSLYDWFIITRSMPSAAGTCLGTIKAKVDRIGRYLDARYPDGEMEVWIGFGADEDSRVKQGDYNQSGRRTERYPLREAGFCRCREEAYARASGYPVPRKSACTFCGKASRLDWQTLRDQLPDMFAAAQLIENNCKRTGEKARLKKMRDTGLASPEEVAQIYPHLRGHIIRYSGTGSHKPRLREYAEPPFQHNRSRETKDCPVCGCKQATKRTGCDYLWEAA